MEKKREKWETVPSHSIYKFQRTVQNVLAGKAHRPITVGLRHVAGKGRDVALIQNNGYFLVIPKDTPKLEMTTTAGTHIRPHHGCSP
ncbi:hypothetical protein SESBI_09415 [Sesbania bispinosa]|nr:hypothetical protein SESBI_09415 [Sesbania bispinosa]